MLSGGIPINYARRQQGRKIYAAQSTHLPLKINMSGVIPPIFASSIILFPATIAQWFGSMPGMGWLKTGSERVNFTQVKGSHCFFYLMR